MSPESLLPQVLFFFGVGFFVANIKVVADLLRFRVRKTSALLVWENPKPVLRIRARAQGHPRACRGQDFHPRASSQPGVRRSNDVRLHGYALPLSTRMRAVLS
jgi:hypothetical protein